MKQIKIGDSIPQFSLLNQDNIISHISSFTGKKNLVIYFYPKDDTPGCTAEACSFRDSFEAFTDNDCEVIGISADSPKSHNDFAKKHRLPFTLLSDTDNKVRKMFGVPASLFGLIPGRVTYVINKQGIVRYIFNSQLKAQQHIEVALAELTKIN